MDVFDLYASLSLDKSKFDQGLNDAEKSGSSIGSRIGSALSKVGKAAMAGIGIASTAISGLVSVSVKGYSEYEQLVGGVDTLFKSSSKTIQKYAANAYKTAGMSANQYMNTATSFSASLIQSLKGDTKKAAEQTNKAITDMSDNVNKMGSSMESIQNAYQGFAKQNYTMLDNLKLGYGGTKEEMERLLEDAEKISGIKYDISSYSDIVDAIHVVQTEMGITGTTAEEAGTTIQGSLGMVKASWENLLTSLSDPDADIGAKIDDFVSSITTAAGNLIPAVEQALSGAGALISELLPQIINEIPNLINDVIPDLLSKVDTLISTTLESIDKNKEKIIKGLVDLLIKLVDLVAENAPKFVGAVMSLITTVFNTLADKSDEIVPKIFNAILNMVDEFLKELPNTFDAILNLIVSLVNSIVDYLPTLVDKLPEILDGILMFILKAIPTIIKSIGTIVSNISDDLPDLLTSIFEALPEMITSLVEAMPELLESIIALGIQGLILPFELLYALGKSVVQAIFGKEAADEAEKYMGVLFDNLWTNIGNFFSDVGARIGNFFSEVWNKITGFFPWLWGQISNAIKGWWNSLPPDAQKNLSEAWEKVQKLFSKAGKFFSDVWNKISEFFSGLWTNISEWWDGIWGKISKIGEDILNNIVKGVKEAFGPMWNSISGFFSGLWTNISNWWSGIWNSICEIGGNIIDGIKTGISNAWDSFWNWLSGLFNNLMDNILGFFGIHSPSTLMRDKVGKNLIAGLAEGIENNLGIVDRVVDNTNERLSNLGDAELQNMDKSFSFAAKGLINKTSNNGSGITLNVNFGDVTLASDMDIDDVAQRVSDVIVLNILQKERAYA